MQINGEWCRVNGRKCLNHKYVYSGEIPCTGVKKCIYCGKPEEELQLSFKETDVKDILKYLDILLNKDVLNAEDTNAVASLYSWVEWKYQEAKGRL